MVVAHSAEILVVQHVEDVVQTVVHLVLEHVIQVVTLRAILHAMRLVRSLVLLIVPVDAQQLAPTTVLNVLVEQEIVHGLQLDQ